MIELLLAASLMSILAISSLKDKGDSVTIGKKFLIPYRLELNKHLCIVGPTRSGKSSLVRALIPKLSKKYIVTIFDWHGEYLNYLPTIPYKSLYIPINQIPTKVLTEVLGYGLGLNEPSIYMLYRILRESKYESTEDLIRAVDEYLVTTRTEAEMKAAILRRLEYVLSNLSRGVIDADKLLTNNYVIDLSDLSIIEEKKLAISLILSLIYSKYLRIGIPTSGVKHVIVVEEAQNLFNQNSILDHIIMELGKYGIRLIMISNKFPKTYLLKHCSLVIFKMRIEFEDEVSISSELRRIIEKARDDEVIVITDRGISTITPSLKPIPKLYINYRDVYEKEVLDRLESKARFENDEHMGKVLDNKEHEDRYKIKRVENDSNDDVDIGKNVEKEFKDIEDRIKLLKEKIEQLENVLRADEEIIRELIRQVKKK